MRGFCTVAAGFKLTQLAAMVAVLVLSGLGISHVSINQWIVLGWMTLLSLIVAISAFIRPLRRAVHCLETTKATGLVVAVLFAFVAAPRLADPATIISLVLIGLGCGLSVAGLCFESAQS